MAFNRLQQVDDKKKAAFNRDGGGGGTHNIAVKLISVNPASPKQREANPSKDTATVMLLHNVDFGKETLKRGTIIDVALRGRGGSEKREEKREIFNLKEAYGTAKPVKMDSNSNPVLEDGKPNPFKGSGTLILEGTFLDEREKRLVAKWLRAPIPDPSEGNDLVIPGAFTVVYPESNYRTENGPGRPYQNAVMYSPENAARVNTVDELVEVAERYLDKGLERPRPGRAGFMFRAVAPDSDSPITEVIYRNSEKISNPGEEDEYVPEDTSATVARFLDTKPIEGSDITFREILAEEMTNNPDAVFEVIPVRSFGFGKKSLPSAPDRKSAAERVPPELSIPYLVPVNNEDFGTIVTARIPERDANGVVKLPDGMPKKNEVKTKIGGTPSHICLKRKGDGPWIVTHVAPTKPWSPELVNPSLMVTKNLRDALPDVAAKFEAKKYVAPQKGAAPEAAASAAAPEESEDLSAGLAPSP